MKVYCCEIFIGFCNHIQTLNWQRPKLFVKATKILFKQLHATLAKHHIFSSFAGTIFRLNRGKCDMMQTTHHIQGAIEDVDGVKAWKLIDVKIS